MLLSEGFNCLVDALSDLKMFVSDLYYKYIGEIKIHTNWRHSKEHKIDVDQKI